MVSVLYAYSGYFVKPGARLACVCLPPRLLITSSVMWRDIDPFDWLNKFYGFYMAVVVGIFLIFLLNQARAGRSSPGFLELLLSPSACLYACVCPPPRL